MSFEELYAENPVPITNWFITLQNCLLAGDIDGKTYIPGQKVIYARNRGTFWIFLWEQNFRKMAQKRKCYSLLIWKTWTAIFLPIPFF